MHQTKQNQLNHMLTLRIVELTIITLICAIFIRPLLSEVHSYFFWIELIDLSLATIFYFVIRAGFLDKWKVTISLISSNLLILPLLAISGGVNSPLAFFLPLMPIMAALIGGRIESLVIGIILISAIVLATIFGNVIMDLNDHVYSNEKTISRSFWLIITIVFSMFFGRFFLQKFTELTDQLKDENLQDPLTNLLNRRGLSYHLEKELNKADINSPVALLLIDIDYFKNINDVYGHDIGDLCLTEVAVILKAALRKNDIIARFGGEEFIIILPNTPKTEAITIAEVLRNKVSQETYSEFKLPLTITLGVTESKRENDTTLKIIKRADKALYKGKDKGRNRVEISEN
ncbi:diguanylate cyclase [Marinomonas ushuaiensis DSM 15871]|uniref:diguanylate cyclase n=1 Tax=Marinomonas ushuaiensis DSM 15871 TaxID=1122207 RepID=X7E3Y9_9GAMM|nr:diguanylate cyclase [Marinomonas ushuaiensis DSM 15871]